jgi:hypothetical protein
MARMHIRSVERCFLHLGLYKWPYMRKKRKKSTGRGKGGNQKA